MEKAKQVEASCSLSKETNSMESDRPEQSRPAGADAGTGAGAGAGGGGSAPEQRGAGLGQAQGQGGGQRRGGLTRLGLPSKNAFVNFLAMLRPALLETSPAEAVERATDRWTQMSEEERRPFFEMAGRVRRHGPHRFLETEMAMGRRPRRTGGFRVRGRRRRRRRRSKSRRRRRRR